MSSRTSRALLALTLSSTLLIAACGGDDPSTTTDVPTTDASSSTDGSATTDPADLIDEPTVSLPTEMPTELVITDITEGEGEAAVDGSTVYVYYVGVLTKDGKRFDGNYGSDPFAVTLGSGAVIPGWEIGLKYFGKGGKGTLFIPAMLAYGPQANGAIKPYTNLVFDLEIQEVTKK